MTSARQIYLGSRRGPALPYDAEVEYLESTGTQWIDTGVAVSNNSHVVVKMSDYIVAGRWLFGARRAYLQNAFGMHSDAGTTKELRLAFGAYLTNPAFTYTITDVGVVTIDINGRVLTITRELIPYTYTETASAQTFTTPVHLTLCALNNNGSVFSGASMKLHGAKIDGVRDLIPVRFTNEQGASEGAMYDRVSGQLFRNSGTGVFGFGTDIAGGGING